MISHSLQVDVVYVGNIHVQHLQSVLMMFEAGKPVLCEKPMTTSVKDTTTLIQAARDKGVFLMEVGYRHAASIPAIMIKYTGSPLLSFPPIIICGEGWMIVRSANVLEWGNGQ